MLPFFMPLLSHLMAGAGPDSPLPSVASTGWVTLQRVFITLLAARHLSLLPGFGDMATVWSCEPHLSLQKPKAPPHVLPGPYSSTSLSDDPTWSKGLSEGLRPEVLPTSSHQRVVARGFECWAAVAWS